MLTSKVFVWLFFVSVISHKMVFKNPYTVIRNDWKGLDKIMGILWSESSALYNIMFDSSDSSFTLDLLLFVFVC